MELNNENEIPVLDQLIKKGDIDPTDQNELELQISEILKKHTQQAVSEILDLINK